MLRALMAAFAALYITTSSAASAALVNEFTLPHIMVEGQTQSELERQVTHCRRTDQSLGRNLEVRLDTLNARWNQDLVVVEHKVRFLMGLGVPADCLFGTNASYPEGWEEYQLVVRTSLGDFFLTEEAGENGMFSWMEVRKRGEEHFYTYFDPAYPYNPNDVPHAIVNGGPMSTFFGSPSFEKWAVPVKKLGRRVSPDTDRDEFTRRFETRIQEAGKHDLEFASHYTLAQWGCGTECWMGAIVNLKTGSAKPLPISAWGYKYRLESNLLIVDDISGNEEYVPSWLRTKYYSWDEGLQEWRFVYWKHPERPEVTSSIN